jgi:hypothetical protein
VFRTLLSAAVVIAGAATAPAQTPREQKVRNDKQKVEADGYWIYNDLPKAFAEAKAAGKPIVVALRCIPCEECVKLDDELVDKNPAVRPLLDQFVRVRQVSTNGLDLSLFQFDTDQSFAMFLLNADGTVYGRFGTRSHRTNWVGDVSIQGLAKALQGALDLHAGYPANKAALAGKRGPKPLFPTPEQFPALKGKYQSEVDFVGKPVQSCIHCHQIGDAVRDHYRARKEAIPEEVLFPYPHPKSQGLVLDPKEKATVTTVEDGSMAAKAGFKAGDQVRTLAGQQLLSMADVQWVLHHTPAEGGSVKAEVVRDGKPIELTLSLPAGWRRRDDITWRSSTWGLRRMATGGLVLEAADDGLRVKHVGQYGAHAAAKTAGFREGDVVVSFDGKADFKREMDLIAYAVTARKAGEKVPVTVMRDGKKVELALPMQN